MPTDYLLLFPEAFQANSPWKPDGAVYARLVDTTPTHAIVEAMRTSSQRGHVDGACPSTRRVTRSEATSGVGDRMRTAVIANFRGKYMYGQVIGYRGKTLKIRGPTGEVTLPSNKAEEIAPIICLLLQASQLKPNSTSPNQLDRYHGTILDRLLDPSSPTSNRNINELLDGILSPDHRPRASDTFEWVDPSDGSSRRFRLQHAIDYAYFVDGDRQIPHYIELGTAFCDEPSPTEPASQSHSNLEPLRPTNPEAPEPSLTIHAQQSTHPQHRSRQGEPNTSLDELLAAMSREVPAPTVPAIEETAPEHRHEQLQSELVAVLAQKPHLLAFYISQCEGTKRKRPATAEPSDEPRIYRPVPPAPSDILSNAHGQGDNIQPKTNFRPSLSQRVVHDAIVAEAFLGKVPLQFIELTISSHATSFKPHPAVLMCLYDFRFGVRGLSVGHLERFDFAARRRWRRETTVNMNNFSTSVNLPKPRQLASMVELQDSLSLLTAFANTFYNQVTRSFLLAAWQFAVAIQAQGSWSAADVDTLVCWFDDVLEDYRRRVEDFVSTGVDSRHVAQLRFSKSDPEYLGILNVISSERYEVLQSAHEVTRSYSKRPRTEDPSQNRHQQQHRSDQGNQKRRRLLPDDVFRALPRQGTRSVCLRFLSQQGCPSKFQDRCIIDSLAHFQPTELAKCVKNHIIQKYGGLKTTLSSTKN